MGIHQPKTVKEIDGKRRRVAGGDPIHGYFPEIIIMQVQKWPCSSISAGCAIYDSICNLKKPEICEIYLNLTLRLKHRNILCMSPYLIYGPFMISDPLAEI